MKSSFTLKCNPKDINKSKPNIKALNVFNNDENDDNEFKVRRSKISELTKDEVGTNSSGKNEPKYIIPCNNKLEDLKVKTKRPEIKINTEDLKFGLNIIKSNNDDENLTNVKNNIENTSSTTPEVTTAECYTTSLRHPDSSPPEVQSNSPSTRRGPSSNYISLKSIATPGDRGECNEEEQKVSTRKNEDVLPLRTESVNPEEQEFYPEERDIVNRPHVEPVADLREAKGQLNKESLHGEWKDTTSDGEDKVIISSTNVDDGINKLGIVSDSEIVKMIMNESDRMKLNEDLFGINDDNMMKPLDVKPILLRNNDKDNNENDMNIKKYDKMPVDEFGLAMLLGMGYDPEKNNIKPKIYKRRLYEHGGLGTDHIMKDNIESILDTKLMSKLKRDYKYNDKILENWLIPGIFVKIIDKNHKEYKKIGKILNVNGFISTIDINGNIFQIHQNYLQTVIKNDTKYAKVVGKINNLQNKNYIPIGSIVKIINITNTYAKIQFQNINFNTSLDNISEFQ